MSRSLKLAPGNYRLNGRVLVAEDLSCVLPFGAGLDPTTNAIEVEAGKKRIESVWASGAGRRVQLLSPNKRLSLRSAALPGLGVERGVQLRLRAVDPDRDRAIARARASSALRALGVATAAWLWQKRRRGRTTRRPAGDREHAPAAPRGSPGRERRAVRDASVCGSHVFVCDPSGSSRGVWCISIVSWLRMGFAG